MIGSECTESPAATNPTPRVRVNTHKSPRPFLAKEPDCKPRSGDRARLICQQARQPGHPGRALSNVDHSDTDKQREASWLNLIVAVFEILLLIA